MLKINLLAEESKQKIKNQRLFFLLLKTEIALLALIIGVALIFLAAEKILADTRNEYGQKTSSAIESSGADYNSKAEEINARLNLVARIQAEFVPYSQYLKNITALMPPRTTLSYLKIDTQTKTVKIRGTAAGRDDLLALEKNLKGAAFLTNADIPLADKLKKEHIEFDIDLGFDPSKLPAD